jgi:hypothetical protein
MALKEVNRELPGSTTPELTSKLAKRRSMEKDETVFQNTPSKTMPTPPPAENAWTPQCAQGAPFAWPLEHVGEIFASPDATWRQAASRCPSVFTYAEQAQDMAFRVRAYASERSHSIAEKAATQARAVRDKSAILSHDIAEAVREAQAKAKDRVNRFSTLESNLLVVIALLCIAIVSLLFVVASLQADVPHVPECLVDDAPRMGEFAQTVGNSSSELLPEYERMYTECFLEFQTHLSTLLAQNAMDKARYGRIGAPLMPMHLMEYADAVQSRLSSLGYLN